MLSTKLLSGIMYYGLLVTSVTVCVAVAGWHSEPAARLMAMLSGLACATIAGWQWGWRAGYNEPLPPPLRADRVLTPRSGSRRG